MRQRRRADRQRGARPILQDNVQIRTNERRYQKMLRWSALAIGLFVLVLLVTGWYTNYVKPPSKVVASLSSRDYFLRDIPPITKIEGFFTGQFNPSISLNTLIKNDILIEYALDLGITVDSNQIEEQLVILFDKATEPSDALPTLSPEGQKSLAQFVNTIGIDRTDYTNWLRGQILEDLYYDLFLSTSSKAADQVFVEWIVTANSLDAQVAYDRILSGEDFTAVANDLNVDNVFADKNGTLGWVPKGALLEMDPYFDLYDENTQEVQRPIATSLGSILFRITDRSPNKKVNEAMLALLAQNNFQSWMDHKTKDIKFTFDDEDIKWVLDQIESDYE